ncbi:unnamed protein product [Durusdinium trenchii]|uniref:Soluble calcium-activated nucleotidase 1 (SCAN-1) (Apyrase homolog) n=2 Tax=Durusdinium trenchii TaxID=1381693 RepID=A0ABP0M1H0_9DINO
MAFCRAACFALTLIFFAEAEQPESCSENCEATDIIQEIGHTRFEFAIVSDLDKASRDLEQFKWHAWFLRGALLFDAQTGQYRLEWLDTKRLESTLSVKNRSMELSELVRFEGRLFAFCDITGVVFEIYPDEGFAIQRLILSDGNGRSIKPFKSEWATVKDGFLIVGSMGREWVGDDGEIQHYNPQWVKQIDSKWHVESFDWRGIYETMRQSLGVQSPGYLWHEAIIWDAWLQRWIVLPRKASLESYSPTADETRGTNVLLLADENFSTIEALSVGPLEPDWGFAALRKVPGTNDTYAALKVLEVGSRTATKICVFDLQGKMLMEPPFLHVKDQKFEGLEFL